MASNEPISLQEKALACAKRYITMAHNMEIIDCYDTGSADLVARDESDQSWHFIYVTIHQRHQDIDWCEQPPARFEDVRETFEHDLVTFFSQGAAQEGRIYRDELQFLVIGDDRAIIRYISSPIQPSITEQCEGED